MSHEMIVLVMFLGMMVLMATGQRVFAMIGFVVLLVRIDWSKLLNKVGVKDASEKSANGSSKP